jgi:hypothetical protein
LSTGRKPLISLGETPKKDFPAKFALVQKPPLFEVTANVLLIKRLYVAMQHYKPKGAT